MFTRIRNQRALIDGCGTSFSHEGQIDLVQRVQCDTRRSVLQLTEYFMKRYWNIVSWSILDGH